MRGIVAAAGAMALVCGLLTALPKAAQAEKETQEFNVGQWTGFSYTTDDTGQFHDCTVWAYNRNRVQVGISVLKNWNLELWLNSDSWSLPKDQTYPVSYWVDRNQTYSGKAAVSGTKFVRIEIEEGNAVFQELKRGTTLTFRTKNIDYIFDLSDSRAALTRLLDCVDQYAKASTSNPFGGDADASSSDSQSFDGQQQDKQAQNGNQQGSFDQGSGSSGGSRILKTMTESAEEVQAFLVDVIGAKPSMVTVTPKTDKSGNNYYSFSTPLGFGQFWQENGGDKTAKDIANDYVAGYKDDCKGTFEPAIGDQVGGPKGSSASGTAACSNSPYQDNGPEFVTFAVTDQDGVVSIYMTYVGGNGGKTKTDALGKLITRRMAQTVQQ